MADFPTITYTNLKHKVSNGISGGVIQTKDEAITVVFNNGIGIASAYKASFNSPHNQITGTLKSNKELTKWEARVTPAEVEDYGPTVGNNATLITGISANTSTNFTIPITQEVFTGSPSNTYRICLMGQSSLDYSWDCTQFYMVIEADKSLSSDYTEVDYIYQNKLDSSGTTGLAYIQSNLSFADIDAAEFDIAISDVGGTNNNIVLCAYATSFYIIVDKNTHRVNGFSSSAWEPSSLTTFSDGQRHKVKVSGLSSSNTTKIRTAWDWTWWRETKWYGLKLYKNNVVIQDLVPCIRDSDNKPGMYDRVSNTFFPGQGSGEFKYGPLKSVPKIYQRVDYIQNTDQQHIDTLVNGNNVNLKICTEYEPTNSGQMAIFSARTSSSNGISFWTDGYCHFGNSSMQVPGVSSTGKHKVELSKNGLYLDGTKLNFTAGTSMANANLVLFRVLNDDRVFLGKIYSTKVYDDNTLIRDLVPCYRKSDNVIGMLDLVNNVFYTNAGSGTFTKGNNVNNYDYIKYKPTDADGYEVHFVN